MTDLHRERMQDRLDTVSEAQALYEELDELDGPEIDTGRIMTHLQRAARKADNQHFDRHLVEALGLIAAQARTVGEDDIADQARTLLETFES